MRAKKQTGYTLSINRKTHVCKYGFMYICRYTEVYMVYECTYTYVCMYVCLYVYVCMYGWMDARMNRCMYNTQSSMCINTYL